MLEVFWGLYRGGQIPSHLGAGPRLGRYRTLDRGVLGSVCIWLKSDTTTS